MLHDGVRYDCRIALKESKEGVGRLSRPNECSDAKRKKISLFVLKALFEWKLSTAAASQKKSSGLAGRVQSVRLQCSLRVWKEGERRKRKEEVLLGKSSSL